LIDVEGADFVRVPVTDIEQAKGNMLSLHRRYVPRD
jgi:hypothetical protein